MVGEREGAASRPPLLRARERHEDVPRFVAGSDSGPHRSRPNVLQTVPTRLELAIVTATARKARGAFFTPLAIARFMTEWAIRAPSDRVLEPSCGEAAFLLAAVERMRTLGGVADGATLRGYEIDPRSARAARSTLADVGVLAQIDEGDFFDIVPEPFADAVVGNPPFVRYQDFAGAARQKAQRAAEAAGVRLDGLASSWAAFVVHASAFTKRDGRLALVLPAELLHVKYAAPVRRFLSARFKHVTLITFERLVFPEVMSEVVLLLAEGVGPSTEIRMVPLRDASDLVNLDLVQSGRAWESEPPSSKWSAALLSAEGLDAYEESLDSSGFTRLSEWGRTYLGSVTGNNSFFALTVGEAKRRRIPDADLLAISPPGSRHLRGLVFSDRAFEEAGRDDQRTYLFYPRDSLSKAARDYIDEGVELGVSEAYKCRMRTPWWRVPVVAVPDLFLTYMSHDSVRLVSNAAQVHFLNSVHGVALRHGTRLIGRELLPLAALNTLSMLGAELVGRSYGGGILKMEPREADLLPVPSVETIKEAAPALRAIAPQLSLALRSTDLLTASRLVDDVLLIRHLGLTRTQVRKLADARMALKERRFARSHGSGIALQAKLLLESA